jgi:hypothetical protein
MTQKVLPSAFLPFQPGISMTTPETNSFVRRYSFMAEAHGQGG